MSWSLEFGYAHIVNAAFTHAAPDGGRFNSNQRGAWYAGLERLTSIAEVGYHKQLQLEEIDWAHEEVSTCDDYLADFATEFQDLRGRRAEYKEFLQPLPLAGVLPSAATARRRLARPPIERNHLPQRSPQRRDLHRLFSSRVGLSREAECAAGVSDEGWRKVCAGAGERNSYRLSGSAISSYSSLSNILAQDRNSMAAGSLRIRSFRQRLFPSQRLSITVLLGLLCFAPYCATAAPEPAGYAALVTLFQQWREFEHPVMKGSLPTTAPPPWPRRPRPRSPAGRSGSLRLDISAWPIEQQNDYKLVKAEMNGLDFNLRVLAPLGPRPRLLRQRLARPQRCALREGPISYPEIELYNYNFPLSPAAQSELAPRLNMRPRPPRRGERKSQGQQRPRHLGLRRAGAAQPVRRPSPLLQAGTLTVTHSGGKPACHSDRDRPSCSDRRRQRRKATDDFVAWLEQLAPTKTGPSGVGKENYTWYQQNVHFLPYTWDEEVVLLHRELERAQASLRLEEHNNRNLPPLEPAADAAAFDKLTHARLDKFVDFLVQQEIIPDKPYIKSALEPQLGHFVPEDKRVFFTRVTHREPMLLLSHDYHWIDLARMRDEPNPSPIRRVPRSLTSGTRAPKASPPPSKNSSCTPASTTTIPAPRSSSG